MKKQNEQLGRMLRAARTSLLMPMALGLLSGGVPTVVVVKSVQRMQINVTVNVTINHTVVEHIAK